MFITLSRVWHSGTVIQLNFRFNLAGSLGADVLKKGQPLMLPKDLPRKSVKRHKFVMRLQHKGKYQGG